MPDHIAVPVQRRECREHSVCDSWGHTLTSFGRRKIREVLVLERMFHMEQRKYAPTAFYDQVVVKETKRYYRVSETERRFNGFLSLWLEETGHLSSTTRIVSSQHYLSIVAMGSDAVPIILRRLKDNPEPWFLALSAITNDNPAKPEQAGHFPTMRKAWLDWGAERGLI